MTAQEGERWGFFNKLVGADVLAHEALTLARQLAAGPTFAHGITKTQLNQEWSMGLDQAIESEAQALSRRSSSGLSCCSMASTIPTNSTPRSS